MAKHKNACYPFDNRNWRLDMRKIAEGETDLDSTHLSPKWVTIDLYLDISNTKLYYRDKELQKNPVFKRLWAQCLKNRKRFIFMFVSLIDADLDRSHANALIFDTKTKELERFEPGGLLLGQGVLAGETEGVGQWGFYLNNAIHNSLKPIIKYKKILDTCRILSTCWSTRSPKCQKNRCRSRWILPLVVNLLFRFTIIEPRYEPK